MEILLAKNISMFLNQNAHEYFESYYTLLFTKDDSSL